MSTLNKDIYFMPLGGGQSVGASCYYLRLGQSNIILDAGVGGCGHASYAPDVHAMLYAPGMYSYAQIDQIYVSHAHMDHIGYLPELAGNAYNASIYMTDITSILAEYQLYDKKYADISDPNDRKSLSVKSMFDKIVKVNYMKPMDFGKYKVNFFKAGHIPGAMMALFEFAGKKILYTGDFSLDKTALTDGCKIPEGLDIDILIMCGLHAKHPERVGKSDSLHKMVLSALDTVSFSKKSVLLRVSQLSKGAELIKMINSIDKGNIPVYFDMNIHGIISRTELFSGQILSERNKVMTGSIPNKPHIMITADKNFSSDGYKEINADFSLHEDFSDMCRFIKKLNPATAVVVHCAKESARADITLERVLMSDGECRTQFIFAEEKELYKL